MVRAWQRHGLPSVYCALHVHSDYGARGVAACFGRFQLRGGSLSPDWWLTQHMCKCAERNARFKQLEMDETPSLEMLRGPCRFKQPVDSALHQPQPLRCLPRFEAFNLVESLACQPLKAAASSNGVTEVGSTKHPMS